jgi:lipoate-protein ligase A
VRAWRLLVDGDAPGPFNMGVDEALLATAIRSGTPTLRFYGWAGPWLSLGFAQALGEREAARLEAAGVGWVRRVTGGRAVLHGADLTYSIAAREDGLGSGVRASYAVVADALLEALRSLGVAAERSAPGARAPGRAVFDCFVQPAADEFCLAGRKLAGSAQRRVGGALLQHGSIRLAADPRDAARAASPDAAGPAGTSLAEAGFRVPRAALERALTAALGAALGARFEPGRLLSSERASAAGRGVEPQMRRHADASAAENARNSWVKPPQESPPPTR